MKDQTRSIDFNNRPSGDVPGRLPNKGVRTGVTDTYGGDLEQGYDDAGKITDAGSDKARVPGGSKNGCA